MAPIDLGIYEPNTPQSKKNATLMGNTDNGMLQRLIKQEMASLDGSQMANFNSIITKYPHLSKEVIVGLIKAGANADTPGIGTVANLDGVQSAIKAATMVDKLKSQYGNDKNMLESIRDTVYGGLKGTTRVGFAALRSPYDYVTTIGRDIYALTKNEKGAGFQLAQDLNPGSMLFGKTTALGSIARDFVEGNNGVSTGSGFFIDPSSRVGKEQAKAMQAFGRINGQSFTIGRGALSTIGADPNSTLYRTASGIIDATLNVALDPTTYASFGVAPAIKGASILAKGGGKTAAMAALASPTWKGAAKGGRAFADAKAIAQQEEAAIKEFKNIMHPSKDEKALMQARKDAAGKIIRGIDNHYMKADEAVTEAERVYVEASNMALTKHYDSLEAATSKVAPEIDDPKIVKWLGDQVISGQQDDTIRGLSKLSADFTNTGKAFPGAFVVETLPKAGDFTVGAQDTAEFVLSLQKQDANVLDLAKDYGKISTPELDLEQTRRFKLYEEINYILNNEEVPVATRKALKDLSGTEYIDDVLFEDGTQNLATILGKVAAKKNPQAMGILTNMIEDIWKVDAFSNIRAIHGGTGGIAIVNKDIIAAKGVDISKFLADSMTPGVILDAPKAIKDAQKALAEAQKKRDLAASQKDGIQKKLKEIQILRQYAAKDPELIQNIVNNPANTKLKSVMDLDLEIGESRFLKELYSAEAGVVDGIGGPLSNDLNSVNEFLLGKRFAVVANVIANETSAARILRLFNNKIDLEIAGALAKAETGDDVLRVLRSHMAAAEADPQLSRSLALRGLSTNATIPLIKTVMPVSPKAVRAVEKMETFFTKQYSRSKVLPLNDLDRLGKGVAEWMGTVGISTDVIDATINKLATATATTDRSLNTIRGKIIDDAFIEAQSALVDKVNPRSVELKEWLAKNLKLDGNDKALLTKYANAAIADGTLPGVIIQNGVEVPMTGAVYAHQFMDDVVRLPDTRPLLAEIKKYESNKKLLGQQAAINAFATKANETWRTAQLAFRVSYVLRNVGEMQFRMYLSGHDTLISHPMNYMAMMVADPNGGAFKKMLTHMEKYSNDIMGNSFKDAEGAEILTQAMDEYLTFMGRNVSAGDMRSADAKSRMLGKIYRVVSNNDPNFHQAFSTTLSRFNLDDMMQLVAKSNTKELQTKLVDDLINNRTITINDQARTNILQEIYEASRTKRGNEFKGTKRETSDFAPVFLKNPEEDFSYKNLNPEGIRNWLFDSKSTASYQTALNGLMGTGQRGIYIRQLLADGVVSIPTKSGAPMVIRMPRYKNSKSIEEGNKADKLFRQQLEKAFPAEEMPGATAIFADSKAWLSENKSVLNQAVDTFFQVAAKAENIAAYGPEYRMAYWDHIGRYAPAMSLNDLQRLLGEAQKTLAPIRSRVGNKTSQVGRNHQTLSIIKREIRRREKNADVPTSMTYDDVHATAARMAGEYTRDLFYDASRQTDAANKFRFLFPFAQAWGNTIKEWGKLGAQNPRQIYKFGKAYDALTKPGTSAIYDLTGTEYEDGQGFFYKDEFGELRFRYPMVGGLFSAFAGMNMNAKDALQLTAPVQSLNLAFGSVNPGMPGLGPVAQLAYMGTGRSQAFGPAWDIARTLVFPFGEPKNFEDVVLPSWMNKTFLLAINRPGEVEKGVKDWAGYLASSGKYGSNPFGNDASRQELFNDAQSMSRWTSLFGALFQSIAPATPSQEVLARIKGTDNKYNFITMTQLYKSWDDVSKANPGNYEEAIKQFADQYGTENLLVILSGSTKSVTGTKDAWGFLNNNPDMAKKYATRDTDIVPYFFPGGEAAMAYYNWQVATSRREKLSPEELASAAEDLVYKMELSQISNEQAMMGYSDIWYSKQVIDLNARYGGKPTSTVITGRQEGRATAIGKALEQEAFKDSPVYLEAKTFYDAYQKRVESLQQNRLTPTPDLGSSFWLNTQYRNELQTLGNQLMLQNPSFSRMYYSVFANLLKKQGA